MNLKIISASQREYSESYRVAVFLAEIASDYYSQVQVSDLYKVKLPLWHEGDLESSVVEFKKECANSDAFIFVIPEWGGAVTPVMSNCLLWVNQKEVGHKPALIVTVSAGIGGANPVSQLRAYGYKNNRINYIPEHLIIRKVGKALNQQEGDKKEFLNLKERTTYVVQLLSVYSRSLRYVRESGVVNADKFAFGM